jgi:DNA-directed RNA polymerase III subunit RPC1
LAGERFQSLPSTGGPFLKEIRDYYGYLAKKQEELMEIDGIEDEDVDRVTWNSCRVTKTQLDLALERALSLYTAAAAEPGEAVGAMGAQSISEPGTQMTLKVRIAISFWIEHMFAPTLVLNILPTCRTVDVSLCWR